MAAQRRRRNGPRVTRGLDLIKRHRTALIPRMVDENRQRPRFVFSFHRNEVRPHHRQVENDCATALSKISNGIRCHAQGGRSEEHTSELQSLMSISYAVFCLKKKTLNARHYERESKTYETSLIDA